MSFPYHLPVFKMSPPSFTSESDANDVRHQFPMNSEAFDPHSELDQPPAFKRARTSDSSHSNAPSRMIQPPPNPQFNKGTNNIFFKTHICAKFTIGACRNGENCNFAHGVENMRQPPPDWQKLVGLCNEERSLWGNWDGDQKIIHKMQLCKKYYNGEEFSYGEKCSFLHEDLVKFRDDSRRFRESSSISIRPNGYPKSYGDDSNNSQGNRAVNIAQNVSRGNGKSTYWKTKLCIQWETIGHCSFGEDCHFAHGLGELQFPGGRIEAETVGAISNSTKVIIPTIPKALSISSNDAPTNYTASLPLPNEEVQGKKNLLKWNGTKKINQIYGDWIDDLPLVPNLPSRAET